MSTIAVTATTLPATTMTVLVTTTAGSCAARTELMSIPGVIMEQAHASYMSEVVVLDDVRVG
jgi:hypothetical protein